MPFPANIQRALTEYDQKKGLFRRLFGDHPAIKALRKLPDADQGDILKIYQCFIDYPPSYRKGWFPTLSKSVFNQVEICLFLRYGYHQPGTSSSLVAHIHEILANYDENKGFIRRIFGDSPAIKALRNLPAATRVDYFNFYQFFINILKNVDKQSATYSAFHRRINVNSPPMYRASQHLAAGGLMTPEMFDQVNKHANPDSYAKALSALNRAGLLNPTSMHIVWAKENIKEFAAGLDFLREVNLLTQANFDTISQCENISFYALSITMRNARLSSQNNINQLLMPNHIFLLTAEAVVTIWSRIPHHLMTQAVLDDLLRIAEQPDRAEFTRYVDNLLGIPRRGNNRQLNNAQSTHTSSVHKTVSESAKKLFQKYGTKIKNSVDDICMQIKNFLDSLLNSDKNQAAKRCIERITRARDFTDPDSKVTTKLLLALSYVAIHDDEQRLCPLEEAENRFIEGLYEIQRGYNISGEGIDDKNTDKPICAAGTFNKLIEALQGVHPDCEIRFLTKETASLKLPKIVHEEALSYLSKAVNSTPNLIDEIKQNGIEVIWDSINDTVSNRMFEEFGELYTGKDDANFIDFINGGVYTDLNENDLNKLQESMQSSLDPSTSTGKERLRQNRLSFYTQRPPEQTQPEQNQGANLTNQ